MKAKIISVLNFKGGVGKTTTTVNLGAALARAGKQVLIIDLDEQCNTSNILGFDVKDGATIVDVMRGTVEEYPIYDTHDERLKFIPASRKLADFQNEINNYISRELTLRNMLEPVRDYFDYILMDCPPNLGIYSINSMCAADYLITPVSCNVMTLQGVYGIVEKYKEIKKKVNHGLQFGGFLLTRYIKGRKVAPMMDQFLGELDLSIYDTRIRECAALDACTGEYQNIYEYDKAMFKPGFGRKPTPSNGAQDYTALADEVIAKTALAV